ncbi:MAG: hypothetical protein H8E20_11520 [Verrucomicrobia bacterium]|nr:hypothetical protein [Verrucomicrobiota bacterium]
MKSALVAQNALIRLRPDNPLAYLFRGRVNLKLGDSEQAIEDVIKFSTLDLNEDNNSFGRGVQWMLGAAVLAETGNLEMFTEYSKRSLKKFAGQRHEVVVKGCLILQTDTKLTRESHAYAIESIESTTEKNWVYIWGTFTAGLAEYRIGNLEKAEYWCQKSLSKIPENNIELLAMNNTVLSLTYGKMKDKSQSVSCFNKAKLHYESLHDWIKLAAFTMSYSLACCLENANN